MDPAEPAAAQQIIAEYAAQLERHTREDVYPAPVGALPYPKEVIKTAVRTSLKALISTRQMTEELRDFLEVVYTSLADYIEDELVRLMSEYRAAGVELASNSRLVQEKAGTPAWQVLTNSGRLVGEIAKAIAGETQALRDEFRELCERLQAGDASG